MGAVPRHRIIHEGYRAALDVRPDPLLSIVDAEIIPCLRNAAVIVYVQAASRIVLQPVAHEGCRKRPGDGVIQDAVSCIIPDQTLLNRTR